jgi:hypothetical protein
MKLLFYSILSNHLYHCLENFIDSKQKMKNRERIVKMKSVHSSFYNTLENMLLLI